MPIAAVIQIEAAMVRPNANTFFENHASAEKCYPRHYFFAPCAKDPGRYPLILCQRTRPFEKYHQHEQAQSQTNQCRGPEAGWTTVITSLQADCAGRNERTNQRTCHDEIFVVH